MRASEGMNKMGILWKLRLPEQEISIAEESGPVRTFRCQRMLFEKLRREEVREGCFIEACFCMEKRMIVEVESVMLEGYVTKWAPKYAFVHANVLPQIKLLGNNRVAELKFMHNPPSSLSSIYLDPQECSFPLENNMAVRFALIANLKKTTNLRNSPYCDMKAIKVTKMNPGQKSLSRRGSSQSSQAVNDVDARLDSWFSRRMSSPRTPRGSGRRTPESRTPEPKFLDEGFRKRGGSTPVKKHVKRDPASQKRKRPPQSAPVTPAKDCGEPDLRQLINMKMPHLSKSRPSSANSALESPPTKIQMGNRCLRCAEDNIELCTHKPPTTHSRNEKEPKEKQAEDELSLILQSKDAECERLRQVVDNLRLQLSQKQNSPSNVQPSYNYKRQYKQTPSLHVSYDQAIKNKHYDTIFAHSPSVSPSSSPVPEMFQDPEKFLPFLSSGGKPSSSRSDIMLADRSHGFDPMAHHHYGTPLTQHAFDPDEGGYFESCSSTNSTPSWTTNSEKLSARECMDYYEPSSSLSRECAISILQPRKDLNSGKRQKYRRKSPREMSEVLYNVPPLKLPAATLDGERRRTRPESHLPLVNQDLNKADTSRWAPVGGEDRPDFSYMKKSRYSLPSRKQPKTSAYKNWDF